MRWKSLAQRLDDCARSYHLTHRNRVHPDCGFIARARQSGRNRAESLPQPCPILAIPQHLQQPVRQRQQQKKGEQRTVERIHGEKSHSKWQETAASLELRAKPESLARSSWLVARSRPLVIWHPIIRICEMQVSRNRLVYRELVGLRQFVLFCSWSAFARRRPKSLSCPRRSPRAPIRRMTIIPRKKLR